MPTSCRRCYTEGYSYPRIVGKASQQMKLFKTIKSLIVLLGRSGQATFTFNSASAAAAVAYFALFSAFPLLIMTVTGASYVTNSEQSATVFAEQVEAAIPGAGDFLGSNINSIVRARGTVTILSVVALLWSGSNVFNFLTGALDRIWQVDKSRSFWKHRGLALLVTATLSGLLMLTSMAASVTPTFINGSLWSEIQVAFRLLSNYGSVLVSFIFLAALYRILPHLPLSFRSVVPGAVLAALLWEGIKWVFVLFARSYVSRSNLVFGSLATMMALLTFVYFSSLILFFGAHVNVRLRRARLAREAETRAELQ